MLRTMKFMKPMTRKYSSLTIPDTIATLPGGMVLPMIASAPLVWGALNYVACKPNQYLVRTGLGIKDMKVNKSGVIWPLQKAVIVDVNPSTYMFRLHNMSKEKVEFELPVVMTIGPELPEDNAVAFSRYCKLLQDNTSEEIEKNVKGIIEGETRGLTASLTIEDMFNGKEIFREKVVEKLMPDLSKLGLRIYNANIQEMKDYDEHNKYFEHRKQRAIEMVTQEARKDVAEAQKQGNIAVAERERDTRISLANYEKEAKIEEYMRQQDILKADANLAEDEANTKQIREVTLIRAQQAVELKKQELQKEIEVKRYEQMVQHQKSEKLAPAIAEMEAQKHIADAHYYNQLKHAEGIKEVMNAQAAGVQQLLKSCEGNSDLAKFYLGNENKLWHTVAQESSKAVKDMKPNITQWQTGNNPNKLSSSITELVQGVVPLYSEIKRKLIEGENKK